MTSAGCPTDWAPSCRQGPLPEAERSAAVRRQTIPEVDWNEALDGQLQRLVAQRGGSPRSRFRGWTSGSIKPAVGFLDHYLSLVVQPDLE